ncbi:MULTISPECIES: fimbrillin family protein [Segatella]|nr:fimbrillin family protein [Segatella copri]
MKLSSLFPQMACALLLMASCSQEDSMTPGESPSSVGGIRITTQVSDIATRGITETATLQNFGICIQGSGEHASSLQYNNVEMTKNGEEWTSATPMLWQSEIPSADIIAYAPYQADISEALATQKQFPVSVKAVQTQEDLSSDLLVFKAKNYAPTIVGENKDKIVAVKFDHAFSQLMITFNFDSAFSNDEVDLSKIEGVRVEGTVLSGVCDFSHDKPQVTVKPDASAGAITPENVSFQAKDAEHASISAQYSSLLVPQTIQAANQPLKVSFRLGETTYSWKSNADITLEQGKYYTLSLNIRKTGVVVEGTIKGWIPAEGNNEYVAN